MSVNNASVNPSPQVVFQRSIGRINTLKLAIEQTPNTPENATYIQGLRDSLAKHIEQVRPHKDAIQSISTLLDEI